MAPSLPLPPSPRLRQGMLRIALVATACLPMASLPSQAQTPESTPSAGGKGAQIYCFMRNNGNSHQVSWDAAYAVIKRQSDKLFKTSPEHAAVMITEAVVQNPSVYPDCGRYLGDLFSKPEAKPEAGSSSAANKKISP